ncbi:putative Glycosyl transferase, group 1 [Crocosphaera subtropica ATCC 51142]|uniref:Glycosyl transferase, group 1 n=2 Tax=Crocosphaera TaxID=263510 RepID=B1WYA1_CROS5|nr:putative Glycosyl transferase, group 1 [Crocosphaera subtropica ATCC 51142]
MIGENRIKAERERPVNANNKICYRILICLTSYNNIFFGLRSYRFPCCFHYSDAMKLLMICATFPYPPSRGGTQVRTFNLLKQLSYHHEITLVTQKAEDVTNEEVGALKHWVKTLMLFPRPAHPTTGLLQKINRFSQFVITGTPPNVSFLYDQSIQNWLDEAVENNYFDVITCEHSVNEIYIRPHWKNKIKTILNSHSSVYRTCKHQLETKTSEDPQRDRLYLPLLKRYEKRVYQKFSHIVVTTEEDYQQLKEFNINSQVSVLPNGVDLDIFPYRNSDPGGHHLIITGGMDYVTNIDAACFFSREIFPLLRQQYPDVTLTIVGANPAPSVVRLGEEPGIRVTGKVPSMAEYLHKATVCVIPLRSGFGIKNKTLEAMATGVPIVASDRSLEGMEVDGKNTPLKALRANKIEEYVQGITDLFEDEKLRQTLSKNGREYIENNFTWERLGREYEKIMDLID